MEILIKGMEMPKGDDDVKIIIYSDGSVHRIIGWAISEKTKAKAIEIPEHGDLIERDKLLKFDNISYVDTGYWMTDYEAVKISVIKNAPVIVEASDGVDN